MTDVSKTLPVTRSVCTPEGLRREMVLHYWRVCKLPTTEIAATMRIGEAEVCRIIEEAEKRETE